MVVRICVPFYMFRALYSCYLIFICYFLVVIFYSPQEFMMLFIFVGEGKIMKG